MVWRRKTELVANGIGQAMPYFFWAAACQLLECFAGLQGPVVGAVCGPAALPFVYKIQAVKLYKILNIQSETLP